MTYQPALRTALYLTAAALAAAFTILLWILFVLDAFELYLGALLILISPLPAAATLARWDNRRSRA
ncbi:hypothetical protein GCM10020367_21280 [Streptomyces sannanensis]|uniref:Uncharacterized protein n=1 Tax=Streptomyces sannanensis TaxID=285536 RepID=A0ABP6S956_9ACTN